MEKSAPTTNEYPGQPQEKYEVSPNTSVLILIILGLLYLLNVADMQMISVVLEMIKKDLGLTDAQGGSLMSILYISASILAFPCAVIIDRWSRSKGIALMAVVWSMATFATGLGKNFIHLAAARLGIGTGEAGFVPGSISWLSLIFPKEKRSRIIGIYAIGQQLGLFLGVVLAGLIAQKTGNWRSPFFFFAGPGILLAIITWFLPDYATEKKKEENLLSVKYLKEVVGLFKIRTLVFHWLGVAMSMMLIFSFIPWLPTMLMRAYGVSVAKAGSVMGLTVIVGIVAAPLGGFLADFWAARSSRGRLYYLVTGFLFATVTHILVYLTMGTTLTLTIVIVMINSFVMPMLIPVFLTVNADVTQPKLRAVTLGMSSLVSAVLGGAWGPLIVGVLSDAFGGRLYGITRGGLIAVVSGPLAALFFFIASRSYPEDSGKISDEVRAVSG
jgi:MFS family permease